MGSRQGRGSGTLERRAGKSKPNTRWRTHGVAHLQGNSAATMALPAQPVYPGERPRTLTPVRSSAAGGAGHRNHWGRPMQEALVVSRETHIPAPAAALFAFLTDPEKILRWMGTEAQVEPQPGGLYLVNVTGARFARGSFREVVPVHRLAYSFGWDGSEVVPPGSSLVEIDLIEQPDGTLLRLTHTGLPQCRAMRRPCGRLGPLPQPAGRGGIRARPWPGSLARPHWPGVTALRSRYCLSGRHSGQVPIPLSLRRGPQMVVRYLALRPGALTVRGRLMPDPAGPTRWSGIVSTTGRCMPATARAELTPAFAPRSLCRSKTFSMECCFGPGGDRFAETRRPVRTASRRQNILAPDHPTDLVNSQSTPTPPTLTPSSIASSIMLTASTYPARVCARHVPESFQKVDQPASQMPKADLTVEARPLGGIIPLRWAASSRARGRHHIVLPGRLRRNRQPLPPPPKRSKSDEATGLFSPTIQVRQCVVLILIDALYQRTERPVDGEGKCAVHMSVAVSQKRPNSSRRVSAACLES
jgi:uncharacterized protein YndB with AHSA1/START domain